jgi:hypothetical protein
MLVTPPAGSVGVEELALPLLPFDMLANTDAIFPPVPPDELLVD